MDRLTSRLQMALADAQSLAVGKDHNYVEPVHVVSVLLEQSEGSTHPLIAQAGADPNALQRDLSELLEKLPTLSTPTG
ncbi:MAG: Clp protease N-terminal domain-containing protein, partial [Pseudomonadales bacterium]